MTRPSYARLLFRPLVGFALAGLFAATAAEAETLHSWRGEKTVVWFDVTNRTGAAALWRPACEVQRAARRPADVSP